MKRSLKKNQIIITALALMIAVAGYVSYTRNNLDSTAAEEASADISKDSLKFRMMRSWKGTFLQIQMMGV